MPSRSPAEYGGSFREWGDIVDREPLCVFGGHVDGSAVDKLSSDDFVAEFGKACT